MKQINKKLFVLLPQPIFGAKVCTSTWVPLMHDQSFFRRSNPNAKAHSMDPRKELFIVEAVTIREPFIKPAKLFKIAPSNRRAEMQTSGAVCGVVVPLLSIKIYHASDFVKKLVIRRAEKLP